MSHSIDLARHQMLALSRASLASLRASLLRDIGPDAAVALQEAGYAGGEAVFASFRDWLARQTDVPIEDLGLEAFEEYAAGYFRDAGWGALSIGSLRDAVATIDCGDWGEADPASALEAPGCHLTTGMFADFFGRMADAPLAVLEVECRSTGAHRCRFLVGSADVMEQLYDEMGRGLGYEEAVGRV
jgi:predicted hydrocarbon binding protein